MVFRALGKVAHLVRRGRDRGFSLNIGAIVRLTLCSCTPPVYITASCFRGCRYLENVQLAIEFFTKNSHSARALVGITPHGKCLLMLSISSILFCTTDRSDTIFPHDRFTALGSQSPRSIFPGISRVVSVHFDTVLDSVPVSDLFTLKEKSGFTPMPVSFHLSHVTELDRPRNWEGIKFALCVLKRSMSRYTPALFQNLCCKYHFFHPFACSTDFRNANENVADHCAALARRMTKRFCPAILKSNRPMGMVRGTAQLVLHTVAG